MQAVLGVIEFALPTFVLHIRTNNLAMTSATTRFLSRYLLLFPAVIALLFAAKPTAGQDLNLSINANKSPAVPGASVTYTVHVSNSGTSDATGAEVEIALPGSTSRFDESDTSAPAEVSCRFGSCDGGEVLTWTVGTLSAGESRALVYRTVISSSASNTTITSPATLSATGLNNVTASIDVEIDDGSSVVIDIGSEASPVASGETFNLRINYGAIQGQGGASFGELRAILPSEVQFVEASGSGSESDGVVSWTLGPVPSAFNGTEVITVQANSGLATGTLLNIAAELDPGNTGESPASIVRTLPIHPEEPLRVRLSASDVPTVRDTRTDFTLTASNTSSSTIEDTRIKFLIPDFLSRFDDDDTTDPVNVSCPFGSCDGGEFLTWTPGDLNPGETRTLFFETGVRDAAFGGALQRFIGIISTPGFAEQTPTYQYGFKTDPVLTVGLDAENAPVAAGGTYTYRVTTGMLDFSNGADDAVLRLELPEEVSFVSATGSPTVTDGVVTWAFGPLGAGLADEQTVTVEADDSLNDGHLLKARVVFDPGTFGETATQGSLVTPVAPESPLKIAFTSNDTPVRPGTRADFTLTVSNESAFPVTDTEVQLLLGGFLNRFDEDETNDPANVSCPLNTCDSGEILRWQAGALGSGESKTLFFDAGTSGPGGDLSRFRGLANTSRGAEQIFTPNIAIDATPVMSLGLSGEARPVVPGGTYTYDLTYGAYNGEGGASNATMEFFVPDGVTVTSTGGNVDGDIVRWNLGAVDAGNGGRRIVTVQVDDTTPEGALLVARTALSSGNIGETTQRASLPLTVLANNPLRLTVTPPTSPVLPGDPVTYDVQIENTGTTNIASPTVQILLSFLSRFDESDTSDPANVSCPLSTCDSGEVLTWTPPDLTPGQTRTLSFSTNMSSSFVLGDIDRMRLEASGAGASTIYQTVNTGIANEFTLPDELEPEIAVSPDAIDFGTLAEGESTTEVLTIENTGSAPLEGDVALTAETVGAFTLSSGAGAFELAPGGSQTVEVIFAPEEASSFEGAVAISHNANNEPNPVEVALSGEGIAPAIAVVPANLEFGGVEVGATATQTVTVENTGSDALQGSVSLSGGADVFTLTAGSGDFTLAPGESREVDVTFAPSEITNFAGTVAISHNASNEPTPVEVSLTGEGLVPASPEIVVSPEAISFDAVVAGESATETLTIQNTGDAALEGSVSLSDTPDAFSLTAGAGDFSIAPGGTQTVEVTFAPGEATSFEGTVAVSHNAGNLSSPVNVAVSGTATPAAPIVIQQLEDVELAAGAAASTWDLTQYVEPPATSSGPLTFSATSSNSFAADAAVEGSTLRITPEAVGLATIEVVAETEAGGTSTLSFVADVNALRTAVALSFGDPRSEASYRLVGLPGQVDQDVAATLSGEPETTWRVFRETGSTNGNSEDFLVAYDGSEAFRFAPGRGFWMLSRTDWDVDTTVDAIELADDSTTTVPLQEGWNILSNPLDQAVAWSTTLGLSANDGLTETLWQWDGSWSEAETFSTAREGVAYYLFNDGNLAELTLKHPAATETSAAPVVAATEDVEALSIAATLGDDTDRNAVDLGTLTIGRAHEARATRLPPAHFLPAQFYVSNTAPDVGVAAETASLSRLLKAAPASAGSEEGLAFDLQLQTHAEWEDASTAHVTLPAALTDEQFAGDEVLLMAPGGLRYDLRTIGPGDTIPVTLTDAPVELRVLIGSQAFIDEELQVPEEILFGPVYPNPSRGPVTIAVALPDAADAEIALYDMLGRRVATLHHGELQRGLNEVQWTGDNLASGMYFLRLQTGGRTFTEKVVRVR